MPLRLGNRRTAEMQRKQNLMMHRRIIDVCMTVLLLFLMAYQVTGEALH